MLFFLFIYLSALIFLAIMAIPFAGINEQLVLYSTGLFTLVGCYPLVRQFFNRQKGHTSLAIHTPDVVLGLIMIVYTTYGAYMLMEYPLLRTNGTINNESVYKAVWFNSLCLMGFLIGYYQTKKGTSWKIPYIDIYKVKVNETPSMLMSLLLFGLAGKTIIILSGNYYHVGVTSFVPSFPYSTLGGFSSFLPYFSLMSLFSGLVAYNLYRRSGLQFWLVVSILIFIFEVVFELPSGSKEKVIKPLVFLGIYFSIQNSLPLKTGLITFFFAVFFVFPFINLYRSGQNLSFTETADTFLADKADGFAYDDEDNFALARRLNGVGVVASVIDQTPEKFGYRYGTDYLALSYVFIPRFIWTGKPAVMDHNGFARQYGLIAPTDFRTSVSPYWQGEAYMNFGWFGVIVAFLLGVFMKKVYLWFFRFGPPTLMLSLMYIGVLYILSRQSQLPMTLLGMLQVVLVTSFLLLPFVSRRSLKNRPHQNKVTEGHHSAVSK